MQDTDVELMKQILTVLYDLVNLRATTFTQYNKRIAQAYQVIDLLEKRIASHETKVTMKQLHLNLWPEE